MRMMEKKGGRVLLERNPTSKAGEREPWKKPIETFCPVTENCPLNQSSVI